MKNNMNNNSYVIGMADTRPWGTWKVIDCQENYVVKTIVVNPNESLSLQYHHHREERWTVVSGTATVYIDDSQYILTAGETVFIPIKARHKLENTSSEPLSLIEVQLGEQLDEQDIVRLEDKYGRIN